MWFNFSVCVAFCTVFLLKISAGHYPAWQDAYWHSKGYWPWEVGTERQVFGNFWHFRHPGAPLPVAPVVQRVHRVPVVRPVHAVPVVPPPHRVPVAPPVHTVQLQPVNVIPLPPEQVSWTFECDTITQAYHVNSNKCVQLGHRGPPCGAQTVFTRLGQNPLFGECQCERPASTCGRPLSHWPDHARCYELYTQGPCEADEWLIPVRGVTSACEKNPCLNVSPVGNDTAGSTGEGEESNPMFVFPMDGNCYVTETQAFCTEDGVARFVDGNGGPACYKKDELTCFREVSNTAKLLFATPASPDITNNALQREETEEWSGSISEA